VYFGTDYTFGACYPTEGNCNAHWTEGQVGPQSVTIPTELSRVIHTAGMVHVYCSAMTPLTCTSLVYNFPCDIST
jgi:hypothetical protein